MPTQSIATTTAKQHSHTDTSDVSAPPRRAWLEACVIAGGVGLVEPDVSGRSVARGHGYRRHSLVVVLFEARG